MGGTFPECGKGTVAMSSPEKHEKPELLSVKEAADYLSLSRKSIDTMIKLGVLQPINLATRPTGRASYRLKRSDLDRLLRERQRKPIIKAA